MLQQQAWCSTRRRSSWTWTTEFRTFIPQWTQSWSDSPGWADSHMVRKFLRRGFQLGSSERGWCRWGWRESPLCFSSLSSVCPLCRSRQLQFTETMGIFTLTLSAASTWNSRDSDSFCLSFWFLFPMSVGSSQQTIGYFVHALRLWLALQPRTPETQIVSGHRKVTRKWLRGTDPKVTSKWLKSD